MVKDSDDFGAPPGPFQETSAEKGQGVITKFGCSCVEIKISRGKNEIPVR